MNKILNYFPSANITRRYHRAKEYSDSPIEDFGFFKQKSEDTLWEEVGEWLREKKQ